MANPALQTRARATAEGDLIAPGNIDLYDRPRIKNPDGTTSTVRSMSFGENGREVLIPTAVGNRILSDEEAIQEYRRSGQHLGIFRSPTAATAYAKRLHADYAAGKYDQRPAQEIWTTLMPDPSLQTIVQRMVDAGESEDNIATVIRHVHQTAPTRVSELEPGTYWAGFAKGAKEGMVGGAKGFVKGMVESPAALVRGVGQVLTTDPRETAAGLIRALPTRAGPGTVLSRLGEAGTDPEGVGRDIGSATGQTMLTMGAPPVVRGAVRAAPAMAGTAARVGTAVAKANPDLLGMISPRGLHAVRAAKTTSGALRAILKEFKAAEPMAEGYERYMPNQPAETPIPVPAQEPPTTPFERMQAAGAFAGERTTGAPAGSPSSLEHVPTMERYTTETYPYPSVEVVGGEATLSQTAPAGSAAARFRQTAQLESALARERQGMRPMAGRAATSEGEPGRSAIPLSRAMSTFRAAAAEAGFTPDAAQTQAAIEVLKEGNVTPADVVRGFQAMQDLQATSTFEGLPTDADVAKVVSKKNLRTTRAKGGTKPGRAGGVPSAWDLSEENPFR